MTVTEQEITDYVDRVRAALADLPPQVRDELTEDLPEHLTEVAAEAGGTLTDRLGAPEAYALDLRAAAGVGTGGGGRVRRLTRTVQRARDQIRILDRQLGPPLGYATAGEFVRLLRPGWWVLRAYLAAMFVTVATTGGTFGLLPRFGGELITGLVMLAGLVLVSVWLGRRSGGLRGWPRQALQIGNAALVVFALVGLADLEDRAGYDFGYEQISVDGRYEHVRDVYVYDSEGRLVENARLFDQNGDPIRLGYPECPDPLDPTGNGNGNPLLRPYPYCPQGAPFAPRPPVVTPPAPGLPPLSTPAPTTTPTPTSTPPATAPPAPTAT
ncbi:hypothetical protein [Micromonospora sp. NPDC049799]|uniref:HAAS signaling domain-containing protein n=1 Tax=Micromonospora sp. NPDC049799 TaxID=3154741 RepID=UPI0033E39E1D